LALEKRLISRKSWMIECSTNRRATFVCLALMLVTLAVYWPARHYDFVQYDDPDYVSGNQTVCDGLSWWGLAWSVVDAHASNWHPLTWLSHMLDCQLFGLDAGWHHLVSVLLHCVNSALLFLLLRTMTGAFWRSAVVAAVFAWHPLRVESVAWISERKDVLSGFFFMLTLLAYAKYVSSAESRGAGGEGRGPNRNHAPGGTPASSPVPGHQTPVTARELPAANRATRWYALALLAFALGLLSKAMLVTTPCILLLIDFWPLNRLQVLKVCSAEPALPGRWDWRVLRGLLLEKAPFFFLAACVGVITFLAQASSGAVVSLRSEDLVSRIGTVAMGYAGYLGRTFWPHDLAVLYLRPPAFPLDLLVFGILILLGVSLAAGMSLRRRPYLVVGWLWFIFMLAPVSGLVQTGLQFMADRYTYLPAIGLGLMIVWGTHELASRLRRGPARQFVLAGMASVILVGCAVATRYQLGYWQNTQTLMEHALEVDPGNYVAHQNLANYFAKLGQVESARAHRQRVLELDPALRANLKGVAAVSPRPQSVGSQLEHERGNE
jgi:tetratricopeptide (TPR) repeat protein